MEDDTFENLCAEKGLPANETSQFKLSGANQYTPFSCSSSEVLNDLFDKVGSSINEENGLESFELERFYEQKYVLQPWVLNKIAARAHNLQTIKLFKLRTSEENRACLLQFVGNVCTYS